MVSTEISQDEDTHLMLEAAAGNTAAYDRLYRKYYPIVVSFVAGLQAQRQTAEDVAQDVFVRIWEKRARYQPSAAFRTYLFGCAKNVYCEHKVKAIREVSVRGTVPTAALPVLPEEDGPMMPLRESIAHLSARQKQVVEMVYLLELSIGQAAERLRCSTHAIHQSLYLARRQLRRFMVRRGGDSGTMPAVTVPRILRKAAGAAAPCPDHLPEAHFSAAKSQERCEFRAVFLIK